MVEPGVYIDPLHGDAERRVVRVEEGKWVVVAPYEPSEEHPDDRTMWRATLLTLAQQTSDGRTRLHADFSGKFVDRHGTIHENLEATYAGGVITWSDGNTWILTQAYTRQPLAAVRRLC